MALTVEDGSGVVGADSYVTVAEVKSFAAARGITTLPAADADIEPLVIKAMDLVESFRDRFRGVKTATDQALQWPRVYVYIDGTLFASDDIPDELKNAVCQLAVEAVSTDLQPNLGGRTVTKQKVDVVEVEYAARGAASEYTIFSKATSFLAPLLSSTGPLTTIRI